MLVTVGSYFVQSVDELLLDLRLIIEFLDAALEIVNNADDVGKLSSGCLSLTQGLLVGQLLLMLAVVGP